MENSKMITLKGLFLQFLHFIRKLMMEIKMKKKILVHLRVNSIFQYHISITPMQIRLLLDKWAILLIKMMIKSLCLATNSILAMRVCLKSEEFLQ